MCPLQSLSLRARLGSGPAHSPARCDSERVRAEAADPVTFCEMIQFGDAVKHAAPPPPIALLPRPSISTPSACVRASLHHLRISTTSIHAHGSPHLSAHHTSNTPEMAIPVRCRSEYSVFLPFLFTFPHVSFLSLFLSTATTSDPSPPPLKNSQKKRKGKGNSHYHIPLSETRVSEHASDKRVTTATEQEGDVTTSLLYFRNSKFG